MTLPIARDLSAVGVRVNTIAPGLIDTPIYGEGEHSDAFKAHLGQSVLFPKRLGSGEELAFAVMECITNPYPECRSHTPGWRHSHAPQVTDLTDNRARPAKAVGRRPGIWPRSPRNKPNRQCQP